MLCKKLHKQSNAFDPIVLSLNENRFKLLTHVLVALIAVADDGSSSAAGDATSLIIISHSCMLISINE